MCNKESSNHCGHRWKKDIEEGKVTKVNDEKDDKKENGRKMIKKKDDEVDWTKETVHPKVHAILNCENHTKKSDSKSWKNGNRVFYTSKEVEL